MSTPIAQLDIEGELLRLSALAEKALQELAKRARAAAEAEVRFKVEYAKAYLLADGPVAQREAEATVRTEGAAMERKGAEALVMSAQEACRTYRTQLDALRSINANHRALVTG